MSGEKKCPFWHKPCVKVYKKCMAFDQKTYKCLVLKKYLRGVGKEDGKNNNS